MGRGEAGGRGFSHKSACERPVSVGPSVAATTKQKQTQKTLQTNKQTKRRTDGSWGWSWRWRRRRRWRAASSYVHQPKKGCVMARLLVNESTHVIKAVPPSCAQTKKNKQKKHSQTNRKHPNKPGLLYFLPLGGKKTTTKKQTDDVSGAALTSDPSRVLQMCFFFVLPPSEPIRALPPSFHRFFFYSSLSSFIYF